MSPDWLSAEQIREQARKNNPEPVYPPPPGGKQVVQQNTRQVCTQVPKLVGLRVSMQNVCTNISYPTTSVSGPSTEETREWETRVAAMRSNYQTLVDQDAARISERQRSDLKSYVKDMIQISTGILGLITGIAALVIGALKGNIPNAMES
jgi:hypothetical protein